LILSPFFFIGLPKAFLKAVSYLKGTTPIMSIIKLYHQKELSVNNKKRTDYLSKKRNRVFIKNSVSE